jgi:hypothetical protein
MASPPSNALAEPSRGEGRGTTFSDGGGVKFPIAVTLSPREIILAALIGSFMQARAIARGWKDRVYKSDWNVHIEGIAAEIAVAKALGIPYRPNLNGFKAPDVGDLHVRWTTRSNGKLVIRPGDPDGIYVLVTGQCPTFTVMGWIHSYDAKQPCYWRWLRYNRAWFIPQRVLIRRPLMPPRSPAAPAAAARLPHQALAPPSPLSETIALPGE